MDKKTINLPSLEEVDRLMNNTFKALKEKLIPEGTPKIEWKDDISSGEGIQSICEGLESFVLPLSRYPVELMRYISPNLIAESIECLYEQIKETGFLPTPYLSIVNPLKSHSEIRNIDNPNFIDTVSYAISTAYESHIALKKVEHVSGKWEAQTIYIISEGLKWLCDYHTGGKGWNGLSMKQPPVSHLYSTWSAIMLSNLVGDIEREGIIDTDKYHLNDTLHTLRKDLIEAANWLTTYNFKMEYDGPGGEQGELRHAYYLLYKLYAECFIFNADDTLIDVKNKTILDEVSQTLSRIREDPLLPEAYHKFPIYIKDRLVHILYQDISIKNYIYMASYSEAGRALLSIKRKTQNTKEKMDSKKLLIFISEKLIVSFNEIKKHHEKNNNLWCTNDKKFSLYLTERAIEALISLRSFIFEASPKVEKGPEVSDENIKILSTIIDDSFNKLEKELKNNLSNKLKKIETSQAEIQKTINSNKKNNENQLIKLKSIFDEKLTEINKFVMKQINTNDKIYRNAFLIIIKTLYNIFRPYKMEDPKYYKQLDIIFGDDAELPSIRKELMDQIMDLFEKINENNTDDFDNDDHTDEIGSEFLGEVQ